MNRTINTSIVWDGTNAITKKTDIIYAKPIISIIKQEERWDIPANHEQYDPSSWVLLIWSSWYPSSILLSPGRDQEIYWKNTTIVQSLHYSCISKSRRKMGRNNHQHRDNQTTINASNLYICPMQYYFNSTHTRTRRSITSRWGILNCDQLISEPIPVMDWFTNRDSQLSLKVMYF